MSYRTAADGVATKGKTKGTMLKKGGKVKESMMEKKMGKNMAKAMMQKKMGRKK